MKKKNGLLLISALGALILSGCSLPGMELPNFSEIMNNQQSESSSQKVEASYSKESSKSSAVSSRTPTPSSSSSSKPTPESSSNVASSSKETINVFEQYGLTGTYYSSLGYLFIRSDGVVSFNERTNGYPAAVVGYGDGLYHIASDSSVPSGYKFDIYTDGVIAYVTREGNEYLFDKNSNNESPVERIQTFNGSLKLFGIQLSYGNEWNFIAVENGVVYGYTDVFVIKGKSFNAKDSVFKLIVNETQRFFIVASNFIVETQLTESIYDSWNGELIVYKRLTGEFLIATLNGQELDGATMNGNIISVPNTSATLSATYDDIVAVTTIEQYVLNNSNNTFTTQYSYNQESIVHEMVGDSGTCSGTVGADGHLWAKFNFPYDGVLEINETVAVAGTDSYLYLYEMGASQSYTNFNYAGYIKGNYNTVSGQLEILGGVNYLIKIGNYYDRNYGFTSTSSQYNGCEEAFEWNYLPNAIDSFSGSKGDIEIVSRNNSIVSIKLDGVPLNNYTIIDDVITKRFPVYNSGDSTPIPYIATYTLDRENHTYTYAECPEAETFPFDTILPTDTSYNGVTDQSGNTWTMFTPTEDGVISIVETEMGTINDTYLAVYDITALNGDISLLIAKNHVAYSDANPAIISDLDVSSGHTYIIKHGSYNSRATLYGGTAKNQNDIGSSLSYDFTFTALTRNIYQSDTGTLVVWFKDGVYHKSVLNGEALTTATYDDGTIRIPGTQTYDFEEADPTVSSLDTIIQINENEDTFTSNTSIFTRKIVHEITSNNERVSGIIGQDGNIWASFTPTVNGYIDIDEVTQATNGTQHDTLLAVYEKRESNSSWSDYKYYSSQTNGSLTALNNAPDYRVGLDNGINPVYVHGLPVEAGKTYIIKIGAYAGNIFNIGESMTATAALGYIGSLEAFDFHFRGLETVTYSGEDGEVSLAFVDDDFMYSTINGQEYNNAETMFDSETNTLRLNRSPSYDLDPLDPAIVYGNALYHLDDDAMTYTKENVNRRESIIHEMNNGDTYCGYIGQDGSVYVKFVASSSGIVTLSKGNALGINEDVVAVYDEGLTTTASDYKGWSYSQANFVTSFNTTVDEPLTMDFDVEEGHTYVIKICPKEAINFGIGQTWGGNVRNNFVNIGLSFAPYDTVTAQGDYGELKIVSLNGNIVRIYLNGEEQHRWSRSVDNKEIDLYFESSIYEEDYPGVFEEIVHFIISDDGTYTNSVRTRASWGKYSASFYRTTGSCGTTTNSNGFATMVFVAPSDGTYTISGQIEGIDSIMGVYSDQNFSVLAEAETGNPIDGNPVGLDETITINATAGQVFFVKMACQGIFNNSMDTRNDTYSNMTCSFQIVKVVD